MELFTVDMNISHISILMSRNSRWDLEVKLGSNYETLKFKAL